MTEIQLTTVDRVLSSIHRDLRGTDLNESDIIEWIGEAMGFLQMPEIQEQAISFLKVENFEANIPEGFQMVLQIARYNKYMQPLNEAYTDIPDDLDINGGDCNKVGSIMDWLIGSLDITHKPYFNMQWQYVPWTVSEYYKNNFSPVRLANNTMFNSIVCKEKNPYNSNCTDEYSFVGTVEKKIRFSFKTGVVALSYIKNAVDEETGYPLIPDDVRALTAIRYYIKWKIAEFLDWNGREGFTGKAQDNERKWLKYIKQAKNFIKMPKSIDQFQNLLEQSHHLIPRTNRYYGYFGNLGRGENRKFNDPDGRNR